MKFYTTLHLELNMDAHNAGELWGISKERAEEITKKLAVIVKRAESEQEIYKAIFEQFSDNEAMYLFGLWNYHKGKVDGWNEAVLELQLEKDEVGMGEA